MRPSLEAALVALTDRFGDLRFAVGGSVLLALLGAEVEPGDIDLVVGADQLDEVRALSADWWVGISEDNDLPNINSVWLARLDVGGEPVEVMGGLALVRDGVRWALPMRSGGFSEVSGRQIPLAPVGQWVALYALYRPARAVELAEFLSAEERERTTSELPPGFGIEWPPGKVLA